MSERYGVKGKKYGCEEFKRRVENEEGRQKKESPEVGEVNKEGIEAEYDKQSAAGAHNLTGKRISISTKIKVQSGESYSSDTLRKGRGFRRYQQTLTR